MKRNLSPSPPRGRGSGRGLTPGLAALLFPKPLSEFFEKAWPDQPFVVHGDLGRLRGLADAQELASVEALSKIPCHAVLAQGQHLDAQRFGNIAVAPELAATLLQSGVTMYFNDPQFRSPSVHRWMRAIEKDLALAAHTIRPSVFLSRRGPGARMHFDCTESFVVQLRGRKVWRIAANEHVPFPPVNYLEGAPLPDELAVLVKRPMKAPTKVRKIVMTPGSVLYLPRGWWHATQTLEASAHLDLLTAVPTWADTIRPLVESIFSRGSHWLTPATAPSYAQAMLRTLLEELEGELD